MKSCPTCKRTYTDRDLSFCIEDGTPLVPVADEDATVISSAASTEGGRGPSQPSGQPYSPPAYQPPGSYAANETHEKRSALPWVVALVAIVLLVITGLGVAAALLVPRIVRTSENHNQPSENLNLGNREDENKNSNLNLNENTNLNSNSDANADNSEAEPPPTDTAKVLSDLTDLEHEWTVANINADKKALDRILADDYVGITDGRAQSKNEYIETINRDTQIEKWEFHDLKVSLVGDRATLTGVLEVLAEGKEARYRFTDKFVWRDNRWQATGSEVSLLKNVNN
jgi:hypothetical protein